MGVEVVISTLPTGIVLLFISCVALCFLLPFFKDKANRQLSCSFQLADWKHFAFFLLPVVLLFIAGQFWSLQAANDLRFFAATAIVAFALSRLNMAARLSGILLLCAVVFAGNVLAPQGGLPLMAMLLGLLVFKLCDNLFFRQEATFEEVLPAIIWLSGSYWIQVLNPLSDSLNWQAMLLASLSVGMLMRLLQGPFMFDDKLYVKRLVLSLSAGLFMLIILNKVLLLPAAATYALLLGVGYLYAYFYQPLDEPAGQLPRVSRLISFLLTTGMLTLIATRLFGTVGLFILAPVAMVCIGSNLAVYAALYWVARGLVQAFVYQFNPNVTGINLTHAYANAGLYAGLLGVVVLLVVLKDTRQRWLPAVVFMFLSIVAPLVSNYILHEEPTGSLLVSSAMAAIILLVAYPVMFKENIGQQGNLLLLPLQMTVMALLSNELISLGNAAGNSLRITVLSVAAMLACLAMIVTSWWLKSRQAVKVAGD